MSQSEFDKLVQRAKGFGIDLNIVMDEIDRRFDAKVNKLAANIIDQVPQLKPDINELAKAVAGQIQTAEVDIEAVAKIVLEKMPPVDEVEKKKLYLDMNKMLEDFLTKYEGGQNETIEKKVTALLLAEKDAMVKDVQDLMDRRQAEMVKQIQAGGAGAGAGAGKGGGFFGNIPWEHLSPLIEKMIDKDTSDPFSAIDKFLEMRNRVMAFEPPGPDVSQQFRASSQSFLEGIKLGAKSRGISEPKKPSGPPGGPSRQPVKHSELHPAVKRL